MRRTGQTTAAASCGKRKRTTAAPADDGNELEDEEHAGSAAILAPKNPAKKQSAMAGRVRENEREKDEDKTKFDEQEKPNKVEQDEEEEEEEMSEYELKRLKRMEENKRLMIATGILQMTKDISAAAKPRDTAQSERRAVEIERKKNHFFANLEALREYGRQHGVFVFCLD